VVLAAVTSFEADDVKEDFRADTVVKRGRLVVEQFGGTHRERSDRRGVELVGWLA
jgi:very-short-patch-repair endonuclease